MQFRPSLENEAAADHQSCKIGHFTNSRQFAIAFNAINNQNCSVPDNQKLKILPVTGKSVINCLFDQFFLSFMTLF